MNNDRQPKPGELYRHFKNKLYQIITVATHTETGEQMVVYQALYGDFKTYVRSYDMFISEVDSNKYPEVKQKYRFELVVKNKTADVSIIESNPATEILFQDQSNESNDNIDSNKKSDMEVVVDGEVNSILLEFLDADSYEEKLAILSSKKKHVDHKLLNAMAASLDCTVEEGEIEGRISGLLFCLQTLARFETNRLR